MKFFYLLTISILCVLAISNESQAARLSLVAGVNRSTPVVTDQVPSYNPLNMVGGGAQIEFMLDAAWSIEIGFLYLTRKFESKAEPQTLPPDSIYQITTSQKILEAPILLKYWFAPPYLSVGLGPYYGRYLGNIAVDYTTTAMTTSAQVDYPAASRYKYDYGIVAALGVNLPVGAVSSILLDARYTIGLFNNIKKDLGTTLKFRDVQLLAGFRFGI